MLRGDVFAIFKYIFNIFLLKKDQGYYGINRNYRKFLG